MYMLTHTIDNKLVYTENFEDFNRARFAMDDAVRRIFDNNIDCYMFNDMVCIKTVDNKGHVFKISKIEEEEK